MKRHQVQFDRQITNVLLLNAKQSALLRAEGPESKSNATALPDNADRIAKIFEQIASAIEQIELQSLAITNEMRALSVQLAKIITKKMVGACEETQLNRISYILLDAIEQPEPVVVVHVNDQQLNLVKKHLSEFPELKELTISGDNSIETGECRVEFQSQELISKLEAQLDAIGQKIIEALDNA